MVLNKTSALPADRKIIEMVKIKQIEQTNVRNRVVTLTELSNELLMKGLKVMEDEKIKSVLVEGKESNPEQPKGFELNKEPINIKETKEEKCLELNKESNPEQPIIKRRIIRRIKNKVI